MKKILFLALFLIAGVSLAQEVTYKLPVGYVPQDDRNHPGAALYVYDTSDETYKAYTAYAYEYEFTVGDGETESDSLHFGITRPSSVHIGADAEGTSLKFQTWSETLGTWQNLHGSDGTEIDYTIDATGMAFSLNASDFKDVDRLKLVVASQTGALTIVVKTRLY